jgi:MSHA biogenesis protein MshO
MRRAAGFTLVELVMVIALSSAIAVMVATVLSRPLQGFVDQSRRAELVDLATMALDRMTRDIRLAVPNSLRITGACAEGGTGCRLELLRAQVGGRYRATLVEGVRRDPPHCAANPCSIEVLSPLNAGDQALLSAVNWMVIYNTGSAVAGSSTWPPLNTSRSVISPKVSVSLDTAMTPNALRLSGAGIEGFRFAYASPQHRFLLADRVVGFDCAGNELRRKEFESLDTAAAYADASPLAVSVTSCVFRYQPGTTQRGGLVSLELTLAKEGEQITLVRQVHVDNAP